jgi:hypothetical protein
MADKLKFALALLLLAAGVAGFYFLGEQPMILRVLSVTRGSWCGDCRRVVHRAGTAVFRIRPGSGG